MRYTRYEDYHYKDKTIVRQRLYIKTGPSPHTFASDDWSSRPPISDVAVAKTVTRTDAE